MRRDQDRAGAVDPVDEVHLHGELLAVQLVLARRVPVELEELVIDGAVRAGDCQLVVVVDGRQLGADGGELAGRAGVDDAQRGLRLVVKPSAGRFGSKVVSS